MAKVETIFLKKKVAHGEWATLDKGKC